MPAMPSPMATMAGTKMPAILMYRSSCEVVVGCCEAEGHLSCWCFCDSAPLLGCEGTAAGAMPGLFTATGGDGSDADGAARSRRPSPAT